MVPKLLDYASFPMRIVLCRRSLCVCSYACAPTRTDPALGKPSTDPASGTVCGTRSGGGRAGLYCGACRTARRA
eukprot:401778-Rhodomonas_salina.3